MSHEREGALLLINNDVCDVCAIIFYKKKKTDSPEIPDWHFSVWEFFFAIFLCFQLSYSPVLSCQRPRVAAASKWQSLDPEHCRHLLVAPKGKGAGPIMVLHKSAPPIYLAKSWEPHIGLSNLMSYSRSGKVLLVLPRSLSPFLDLSPCWNASGHPSLSSLTSPPPRTCPLLWVTGLRPALAQPRLVLGWHLCSVLSVMTVPSITFATEPALVLQDWAHRRN